MGDSEGVAARADATHRAPGAAHGDSAARSAVCGALVRSAPGRETVQVGACGSAAAGFSRRRRRAPYAKYSATPIAIHTTSRAQVAPGRVAIRPSETTADAIGTAGTHGVRNGR